MFFYEDQEDVAKYVKTSNQRLTGSDAVAIIAARLVVGEELVSQKTTKNFSSASMS